MKHSRILLILSAMLLLHMGGMAQQRDTRLTIKVNTVQGDILTGQPVTLTQTDYGAGYGTLKLDADGTCSLNTFSGNHRLELNRDGFEAVDHRFVIADGAAEQTVTINLVEKTRDPFALKTALIHDPFTGSDDLELSWNREEPAFFDDFESYEPFAIEFGEWTGIDADLEAAAPLVGTYPNRGVMQYAQIINPMTVTPTWWYDYPILRPYSGQQYAGFVRTSSGNANDDWLISPAITVGTDNILSFMAKAADQYDERFMVYYTTVLDNPQQTDFKRLDTGNYESVDYRGWHTMTYDLASLAGQRVKLAIRYIAQTNIYGAFMLMVDDFYVGQAPEGAETAVARARARRVAQRSPGNRFERFEVYLDGVLQTTVDDYSAQLTGVAPGTHTVGVKAVYLQTESATTETSVEVPGADSYASVTFSVSVDSKLSPEGLHLALLSKADATTIDLVVADGKANVPYLPKGSYELGVGEGAYEAVIIPLEVTADATIPVELADRVITPYNLTVTPADDGSVAIGWNQELAFSDSFEDYDDFATGSFGDWVTVDVDQMPVYPIALGSQSNVVSFPGSGTATNPVPMAPMVFNPYETVPAMMPSDPAIGAITGRKTVIFCSSQLTTSDKWLISPLMTIREGFELTFKAKAYTTMYVEKMEVCVATDGSTNPADFVTIRQIDQLTAEQWSLYTVELDEYAGMDCRIGLRYTSRDAFLAQVDDVTIGPAEGQGEVIDYGNVVRYEVYVDGVKVGETETPGFTIEGLEPGSHTIGVKAVYKNGESDMATYSHTTSGIDAVAADSAPADSAPAELYDLTGRRVDPATAPAGVYIERRGDKAAKIVK